MTALKTVWHGLTSLVVDDGFLAIAALVAVGVTGLISRTEVLGPTNAAGWALFSLLSISTVVSCRRAVNHFNGVNDHRHRSHPLVGPNPGRRLASTDD